jgi:aminodeoxyfutalosine deaminase
LKILQQSFSFLTLQDLIRFATLNGARALQMENQFGSFEKDKKPGINLIQKVDLQSMKLTDSSIVTSLIN